MPRYRATIEYDGTPFVGWQAQPEGLSIQGCIATAIAAFAGEPVVVRGAGRTDAGVHALGQVAHFDLARDWPAATVRDATNYHLKSWPIALVACVRAPDDFDARFTAVARHYRYRIVSRRAPLIIERHRARRLAHRLDVAAMAAAAHLLLGRHDFTTFRAAACQAKSPLKTLDRLDVRVVASDAGSETIHIEASARSFLHNQVRSLVGSLKLVGDCRWSPADLAAALAARDRARCGPVAPAMGLYLLRVDYGDGLAV